MTNRTPAILALPFAALACAPVDRDASADPAATTPAVRVTGDAQSCILRDRIRQTEVRSDQVIDFEMQGGEVYRNTLPQRCPGLRLERAITYETSVNQLCTPQIIYVLQNVGGVPQRGAGCSLGAFVPVDYVKD